MKEPPRNNNPELLDTHFHAALDRLMGLMRSNGYDPVIFEGLRTEERQKWLYGVGRTHSKNRKPVTWTLKSKHLKGMAADVISKKRLWNWPAFYVALKKNAAACGLRTLKSEGCHVEM